MITTTARAGEKWYIAGSSIDGGAKAVEHFGFCEPGNEITTGQTVLVMYSDYGLWRADLAKRGIKPHTDTTGAPTRSDRSYPVTTSASNWITDIGRAHPKKRVLK